MGRLPNHEALRLTPHAMGGGYVAPRAGSPSDPLRTAVLISGGGSGLASLLRHQSTKPRSHRTTLVISESTEAGGLDHGRAAGIKTVGIPIPEGPSRRREHEKLIQRELEAEGIELVVLSGYMRILTPEFVSVWKGRLVNIHPSLLPDFPGAHAHRDALEAGVTVSGCTVHLVDEGVDSGHILEQRRVPVLSDDTEKTLQERIKAVEHELYPLALDRLSNGDYSF